MCLVGSVLDEVDVAGGAVGADVAVAGLVAVALDASAPVVSVAELAVGALKPAAALIGGLVE